MRDVQLLLFVSVLGLACLALAYSILMRRLFKGPEGKRYIPKGRLLLLTLVFGLAGFLLCLGIQKVARSGDQNLLKKLGAPCVMGGSR